MTIENTYDYGTVAVTNGSDVVTGTDTLWSNVRKFDKIVIADAAPRIIVEVTDESHLKVVPPWDGDTTTGLAYVITYDSNLRNANGELALNAVRLRGDIEGDGYFVYVLHSATEPDPSKGKDGQYARDPVDGRQWAKIGGVWVYQGIFAQLTPIEEWQDDKDYNVNSFVEYEGGTYVGKRASLNAPPASSPDDWLLISAKGDKGDTSTITIGTVTTGLPGTDASVVNSGTDTDAIFDITIPRGNPGAGDMSSANYASEYAGHEAEVRANIGAGDMLESIYAPRIYDFDIIADAVAATIPASQKVINTAGRLTVGDGGGARWKKVTSAPAHGASITSVDGLIFELDETRPDVAMFVDPAASDCTAGLVVAMSYCNAYGIKEITCNDDLVCTSFGSLSRADQAKFSDVNFVGTGSLKGVYRKYVAPPYAAAAYNQFSTSDLIPALHLSAFLAAASPVVVLVGDSISTYYANQFGRQNTLMECLREHIANQFPDKTITFRDMSITGLTYANFNGAVDGLTPWATTTGKLWREYVHDLNPDLVILAFGMNDSSTISAAHVKLAIDSMAAWSKAPSVVMCTNLVPAKAYTGDDLEAMQEGRDMAAGFTRTYAKYARVGLLDFHREYCMTRDGFDPTSGTLKFINEGSISPASGAYTGTRKVYDYQCKVTFPASTFTDGDGFTFVIGPGDGDWLAVGNIAGAYGFQAYSGNAGDYIQPSNPQPAPAVPTTGTETLVMEVRGNRVMVYRDTPDFGAYIEPIFAGVCVRRGGLFFPKIISVTGVSLTTVNFNYVEPRVHRASVLDSQIMPLDGYATGYGGGFIHPSSFIASYVYRPLLQAARFRD